MSRPVSENLAVLLPRAYVQSTVEITLRDGVTVKRFATENINIDGENYPGFLKHVGELQETLGSATNGVSVKIQNVDDILGQMAADPDKPLELADVVVRRFYTNDEVSEHKHIFTGKLVKAKVLEPSVDLQLIPDTTAAGICIAIKTLSPANGWRFPGVPVTGLPDGDSGGGGIGNGDSGGGDEGPCFISKTGVPMWSGEKKHFGEIWANYDSFIGREIKGYDDEGNIKIDYIDEIFRHVVFEYLDVRFSDGSGFGVTPEHPFWNELKEFVAIGNLTPGSKVQAFLEFWQLPEIVSIERVEAPEGIEVFNLRARLYEHYLVCDLENESQLEFAVHNRKSGYDDYFGVGSLNS